jgi:hypothetical protein
MAQHDYVIANGTGAAVRSDLNNGLAAIVSQNSGATAPATTYAYMTWADTTAGVYKMRNGANNAWISLYQLDGEWSTIAFENGSAAAPSIYFKDSGTDTGIYSPGTDQVAITTGGTQRLAADTAAVTSTLPVVHPLGAVGTPSITFTGDTNTGLFSPGADTVALATAGSNRLHITSAGLVGVGTSFPSHKLEVYGSMCVDGWNDTTNNYITLRPGFSPRNSGGSGFTTEDHSGGGTDGLGCWGHDGIRFSTAQQERLRITAAGLVGIGTSTPSANLHVAGTAIKVDGSSTATVDLNGSAYGMVSAGADLYLETAGAGNQVIFRRGGIESARFDASGRLGIGNTGPSNTLSLGDVGGIGQDTNSLYVGANFTGTASFFKKTGNFASQIHFDTSGGTITFKSTASTGTAGSSISFIDQFRISSTGAQSSVIPGGSTLYPSFDCRAWVNWNGTGTVAIRASGNVSSITDNGVGDYAVNLTTAMPDANYSVCFGAGGGTVTNPSSLIAGTLTTSSFPARAFQGANAPFDQLFCFAAVFR